MHFMGPEDFRGAGEISGDRVLPNAVPCCDVPGAFVDDAAGFDAHRLPSHLACMHGMGPRDLGGIWGILATQFHQMPPVDRLVIGRQKWHHLFTTGKRAAAAARFLLVI